mgnify:FL=1
MSNIERRKAQLGKVGTQPSYVGREPSYHNEHPFKDSALGLVSTKSFPAIVGTADMMLKSSEVTMVE